MTLLVLFCNCYIFAKQRTRQENSQLVAPEYETFEIIFGWYLLIHVENMLKTLPFWTGEMFTMRRRYMCLFSDFGLILCVKCVEHG